jgi:hypothetical protein
MAERALRSKGKTGFADSLVAEVAEAQVVGYCDDSRECFGEHVARTRSDDTDNAEPSGEIIVVSDNTAKESQANLLAIIWQTLQKGEEERKEKEMKDEEYRKKIEEIRQKERDEDREKLEQMRQVIVRNTEVITTQLRAEIVALSEKIASRIDKETRYLSESITSLRSTTQQEILSLNVRVDNVT